VVNLMYGSQETSISALNNGENKLLTLPLSYVYEVIDVNTGELVSDGEIGELVLTTLQPYALKPLLRYRTGDVCKIVNVENSPRQQLLLEGRVSDHLEIMGRTYSPAGLEKNILKYFDTCIGYIVTIRSTGDVDRIYIELVFSGDAEMESIKEMEESWIRKGVKCKTTIRCSENSQNELLGMVSWKKARVKDKRTPAVA